MERRDLLILAGLAVLVVAVGGLWSDQPLGSFLAQGAMKAASTALAMAWVTWWALVLGFTIAGGVEAWVPAEAIERHLEGSGPRALGLGTFFGFVSSSCSYSAIATAKNLFKKGASAAASLGAFMFASTNLVIEIGLVMWLLLGWQFVVADFVGGLVLIAILALVFRFLVPAERIAAAREHARGDEGNLVRDPNCGMEVDPDDTPYHRTVDGVTYHFCSEACMTGWDPEPVRESLAGKATSLAGWRELADKQWKEWGMLWDEILVGFVFAGIVAGFVPSTLWKAVFSGPVHGGLGYLVWTAVLGALVGVLTFVCSVGNVPFATILWTEGLPFGAVLSFIYSDLVIPPIVSAYRRYYGTAFAAILSAAIFGAAVVTGLLLHGLFGGLAWIPPRSAAHVASLSVGLDYRAALNGVAALLFGFLAWLHLSGRPADDEEDGHGRGHGQGHRHEDGA